MKISETLKKLNLEKKYPVDSILFKINNFS